MKGLKIIRPGFSLLELVLALGLVSLVVLFATNFLVAVIQTNAFSQERTAALALAQDKMEDLKARPSLTALDEQEINITNGNSGTLFRRATSVAQSGGGETLLISVQVTWPRRDGPGDHRVALSSQMAQ
jgi:prepilin-type N-terminal cleavage/methylation domain-containing protein